MNVRAALRRMIPHRHPSPTAPVPAAAHLPTRDLSAEIAGALEAFGAATADEIARFIGARTQLVRQALADDDRFRRVDNPRSYGRSPTAKLYELEADDDNGKSLPPSIPPEEQHPLAVDEPGTVPEPGFQTERTTPDAFAEASLLTGAPDPWAEDRLQWLLAYGHQVLEALPGNAEDEGAAL